MLSRPGMIYSPTRTSSSRFECTSPNSNVLLFPVHYNIFPLLEPVFPNSNVHPPPPPQFRPIPPLQIFPPDSNVSPAIPTYPPPTPTCLRLSNVPFPSESICSALTCISTIPMYSRLSKVAPPIRRRISASQSSSSFQTLKCCVAIATYLRPSKLIPAH